MVPPKQSSSETKRRKSSPPLQLSLSVAPVFPLPPLRSTTTTSRCTCLVSLASWSGTCALVAATHLFPQAVLPVVCFPLNFSHTPVLRLELPWLQPVAVLYPHWCISSSSDLACMSPSVEGCPRLTTTPYYLRCPGSTTLSLRVGYLCLEGSDLASLASLLAPVVALCC